MVWEQTMTSHVERFASCHDELTLQKNALYVLQFHHLLHITITSVNSKPIRTAGNAWEVSKGRPCTTRRVTTIYTRSIATEMSSVTKNPEETHIFAILYPAKGKLERVKPDKYTTNLD